MHPSQQLFFQFSFVWIYTDTGASELEIVKGISSLSHLLAADRGKIVFCLFLFFIAISGCERILRWKMRQQRAGRAALSKEDGGKKGYFVTSNVQMTAWLRHSYVHNADSDKSCCKMRHLIKVTCGICMDLYTQFKQRFIRHSLIVLPRCDTCSAATCTSAFRVGLERVSPWTWTLAVG